MEKTPNKKPERTLVVNTNQQVSKSKIVNEYASAIMTNLKLNKLSSGTQLMMENEKMHANEAIESGIYVSWSSSSAFDCFRIGSNSTCICTHGFTQHEKILSRKKFSSKCQQCGCKGFNFIPTLPEEIGEYWIPHQPKFDYSKWTAKCKCKHSWREHLVEKFLKCLSCSCFGFTSNFCCVVCDKFWHDHQMNYELEHDRMMKNKPIGNDWLPLSELPQISNLIYKK
jgi:hypothetical protein